MPFRRLAIERRGAVAEIRLTLPDRGKAVVDVRLLDEIDDAAAQIGDDASVRVALLAAAGGVFPAAWRSGERLDRERLPFRSLELMPQPVIACVEGNCYGAALALVLACDIRIAAEGASFALPGVASGDMPWAGVTQRLPRLVGRAAALQMALLGEPLDAAAALACGLINQAVPPAAVRGRCEAVASAIAARGPLAVRFAKEAVARGLDMPLEQALRYETDLTVILQTTADRAEGVQAFLEKRDARFEGR